MNILFYQFSHYLIEYQHSAFHCLLVSSNSYLYYFLSTYLACAFARQFVPIVVSEVVRVQGLVVISPVFLSSVFLYWHVWNYIFHSYLQYTFIPLSGFFFIKHSLNYSLFKEYFHTSNYNIAFIICQ